MTDQLQDVFKFLFSSERYVTADEEELCEGGVGYFMEDIRPFLEARGVELTIGPEQQGQGNGYSVVVNGEVLVLYTEAELADGHRFVGLTTERTTAFVNRLLTESGAMERMYCLGGWNDMSAIFLTQDEHKHVCSILEAAGYEFPEIPYDPAMPNRS